MALGAYLCITGLGAGGVQTLVGGAIIVLGTLCERWRYHNRNAAVDGDWQPTGERFVDPATGKNVEVLYDPETNLPVDIHNYDWPESGHSGDLLLAEHYHYENLNFDAALSEIDFAPANPAYDFRRF